MAVTLNAAQCPAVQVASGILSVAAGGLLDSGNSPSQEPISSGQTAISDVLRRNQTRVDLIGRYGGGLYAVCAGLALSQPAAGTLLLPVSAGQAMCDGIMAVEADTTKGVPDNTNRVWIWLQRGTPDAGPLLQYSLTTDPPPGMPSVLLGSCKTGSGSILSVDTSGVMYLRGGVGWRETGDGGAPMDAPPSSVQFAARTLGGTYWWDGGAYSMLSRAVAALVTSVSDEAERLEALERKFRAVLAYIAAEISEGVLTTQELIDDYELASLEAQEN